MGDIYIMNHPNPRIKLDYCLKAERLADRMWQKTYRTRHHWTRINMAYDAIEKFEGDIEKAHSYLVKKIYEN